MFLLVVLLLFADSVNAAEEPGPSSIVAWKACADAVYNSREAQEVESFGGKSSVEDYLVKMCGYRPVFKRVDGRMELSDADCADLFEWSNAGACVPADTGAIDLSVRELDPRVFNRSKYSKRCWRNRLTGRVDDYRSFRAEICSAPLRGRSQKP